MSGAPVDVWNETQNESGISKEFYDKYFQGKDMAYAYHITELRIYDQPLPLSHYHVKKAPQSYMYVDD